MSTYEENRCYRIGIFPFVYRAGWFRRSYRVLGETGYEFVMTPKTTPIPMGVSVLPGFVP